MPAAAGTNTASTATAAGEAGAVSATGAGNGGAPAEAAPPAAMSGMSAGVGTAAEPQPHSAGTAGLGAAGAGAPAGAGANPDADRAGAAGSSAGPPACSGKPGSKRGKSAQTVMAKGPRSFVYYAPQDLDPNKPAPLVIVPHGYTQSGQAMFDITRYSDIADREGLVVIFPDGAPGSVGPWDVGTDVCGNGTFVPGSGDDQAFIDEMIAFADADQCIDHQHIFMTGWSMGGYLSNHSGCLRDDIRAIGPHSGGTHDLSACPVGHKPVILFHFDPDGLIAYRCGQNARDEWVKHNGCSMDDPEVKPVKGGRCEYYRGCPKDGQVAFCTFEIPSNHSADFLAGHAWSGGTVHSYSIAETESASELGWEFFKTYAW